MKYFAGIDIHKDSFYGTILDEQGKVINEGEFKPRKEAIEVFLSGIPSSRMRIAIESCGMWRGFYKTLNDMGYDVVLANPVKVKDVAGKKTTDKVIAKTLADLLRTGYLPEVYVPTEDVLKLRYLARHRANLIRLRTKVQCKIKGYMLRQGLNYNKRVWNQEGMEHLRNIGDEKIINFLNIIDVMNKEIKDVTREVNNISCNMYKTCLLQTMPGIGKYSSLLILTEIADIKRFKTPKELVSYAGLCPGIHQSGSKQHTVKSRACNKWLKWIMIECSGIALKYDQRLMRYYYKIKKRKGFQTARRALARKMLTIIWHMLMKEEPYAS